MGVKWGERGCSFRESDMGWYDWEDEVGTWSGKRFGEEEDRSMVENRR